MSTAPPPAGAASHLVLRAKRLEMQAAHRLGERIALVDALRECIHAVQHERGASSVYLASGGTRFEAERAACAAASVEAEAAVRAWLHQADILDPAGERAPAGGARLFTRIALALHGLDALPGLRAMIAAGRCAPRTRSAGRPRHPAAWACCNCC